MAIQNQGNLPRLLQEGVEAIAGAEYERYSPEWKAYLDEKSSQKAYELDVYKATLGTAQLKPEGSEVATDAQQQLYTNTFANAVYGIGTEITYESILNNLYEDEMEDAGRYIENSLQEVEQIVAADVINSGYTTFTIGDGQPVFSTAHLLKNGTFSNTLSVPTALSEAALEDASIAVGNFVNGAGLRQRIKVESLVVPNALQFDADRLMASKFQPNTANNAVNAIVNTGTIPQGYAVDHYFTDPTSWFLKTNVRNGGKFIRRTGHEFRTDNSNTNTMNYRCIGTTYFSVGVTDPRAYYGNGAGL